MRRNSAVAIALLGTMLAASCTSTLSAQAPLAGGLPGRWIEANALVQSVTGGYGDWQGGYIRAVRPSAHDTWWVDALALRAFGERGIQVGAAHRHDWSTRVFHMLGGSFGNGASIMPRGRVDGGIGVRLGAERRWQAMGGASYVKSVSELSDVAGVASLAYYAPIAVIIETGVRYNVSRPGDVASHRLWMSSAWTPSPRRTLSLRAIGGSEGWQTISTGKTLARFHSQELSAAWREKVLGPWALSAQGDWYRNPFYTRSGVTLGVARYW